ncbi:MAG: hypothetical protein ACLUN0_04070 [Roseburia sp.]
MRLYELGNIYLPKQCTCYRTSGRAHAVYTWDSTVMAISIP